MTYKERYEYQKEITLKQRIVINCQKAQLKKLKAEIFNYKNSTLVSIFEKAKAEAIKEFAGELIEEIVNTPTTFGSSYYMYRQGIAFRQSEIIDIIRKKAGEGNGS